MYLHLGQNVVVPTKTVIGVFDLDNTTGSQITRAFLKNAEKAGQIVNISDDLPKSFIVCSEDDSPSIKDGSPSLRDGRTKIYLSQLASTTLLKRSETMRFD
jgi:hypothetical protein